MNPYTLRYRNLNPARLPIPPYPHRKYFIILDANVSITVKKTMSQNINKCDIMFIIERVKIFLKSVLTSFEKLIYNSSCVAAMMSSTENKNGVWLSLARAPGLGPGGRRFESCHPDSFIRVCNAKFYQAGVVHW